MDQCSAYRGFDLGGYRPGEAVRLRPIYEGIGNALRCAYASKDANVDTRLPPDLSNLLALL